MKHTFLTLALLTLLFAGARRQAEAQGTFANLNFENPVPSLVPGQLNPIADVLPGWTAYIGGIQQSQVGFDAMSIGSAWITLMDAGSGYQPYEGIYFVLLQRSFNLSTIPAIGQVGTVPATAESVRFYGYGSLEVSFAGQPLPLAVVGSTASYTIYGGDISSFAGQTGLLQFEGGGFLDNIFFSTEAIPEPGDVALSGVAALLVGWRILGRRRL